MGTNGMKDLWVEKYRPSKFDDIVLDPNNKKILSNIVKRYLMLHAIKLNKD